MKKKTTTTTIFVKDRNYIESLKRKNEFDNNQDTIQAMCRVIRVHKFQEELK